MNISIGLGHMVFYASYAPNKKTRRSYTDLYIYFDCYPIVWYSKRHVMVEGSKL